MKNILTGLFIAIAQLAMAQETENTLNPVTVTATLQELPASKTGRNIVSLKGEYFQQLPIRSIDELLRYIPGVEVQQRGPAGSQADIVIRGGTFQQVLVLLDGLRLNDPNTGHFTAYIPISPVEIDRVEILKGAASAIYGSEAVGGVIHVITKTFAARKNVHQKQLSVQANAGQFGLWGIQAGSYYQKKYTAIAGGILSNQADGQQQRGTTGFYNNQTVSISISHAFKNNWRIAFRSAYDKRDFSAQNYYTTFKSDTAKEKVTTYWNQLSLGYQQGKNQFQFDAGYKKVTDQYTFNSGSLPNQNLSALFQIGARYTHRFSVNTQLITGVQVQNKTIESNDRGNHEITQTAGYVLLQQAIGENLLLTPALRVDHIQNSGTELVPQLNLSYKTGMVQWRGSVGKTIRQSDFTEAYNNYNKTLVTSGSIGNPNLAAERSLSYEVGADLYIKKNWRIATTIFQRDQQKVIDWVPTPYNDMPRKTNLIPTGTYALASNIAKVKTAGIETDIQYQQEWNKGRKMMTSLGFVWLDSKVSEGAASFYLSSHAKLLMNASMVYTGKFILLSANAIYKIRTAAQSTAINADLSENYFVMNTRAQVFVWQHKLGIYLEANNLFDCSYSDLLGAPMPGRWLVAGLNINF